MKTRLKSRYKEIVLEQRNKLLKLDSSTEERVEELYLEALKSIGEDSEKVEEISKELHRELYKIIFEATKLSSKYSVEAQGKIMKELLEYSSISLNDSFPIYLNKVHRDIIEVLVEGDFYKDGKTISDRIWNYKNEFDETVQGIINAGVSQGRSAVEIAKDLEEFVKPASKRPIEISSLYPYKKGSIDYNALRLARTTINHTYQTATIKTARTNPFTKGIKWLTSNHNSVCELCRERSEQNDYGLGEGVYPVDEVPLDHPNGKCTLVTVLEDLDEIADRLRDWALDENSDDEELNNWYEEFGQYFIDKEM